MYMYFIAGLFVLVAVEGGVISNLDLCDNGTPLPDSVDVSGCTTQPCPLVRGSNVQLILNFTAPYELATFNATVRASYGFISLTFPLPDPVGCNSLINTRCPLEEGEPGSYQLAMPVSSAYPAVSNLRLTFALVNPQRERFACFIITTYVTSG